MNKVEEKYIKNEDCEMCGGKLTYDPIIGAVKCSFCGHIKPIERSTEDVVKMSIHEMENYTYDQEIGQKIITCQNCGGKTIVGSKVMASACIYCQSHHIIENEKGNLGLRPKGVIPFKIDSNKASTIFKNWLVKEKSLKRSHIPKKIIKENRFQEIKAIYMPYWSFDVTARVTWHRQEQQHKDEVNLFGDGTGHVMGTFSSNHDNQLVLAVKSKFADYLKWINPYDLTELVDYKPDYLIGYYAQKYNIKPEDALTSALSEIYSDYEDQGYRETRNSWNFIDFDDMKFNLYLLPVYFTSFWHKGDLYFVVINGQNGNVYGGLAIKPPKKKKSKKIARISFGSFSVTLIFVSFYLYKIFQESGVEGISGSVLGLMLALLITAGIIVYSRGYI